MSNWKMNFRYGGNVKTFIVASFVVAVVLTATHSASAEFYYGGGGQISLRVDSSKVAIKFNLGVPQLEIFQNVPRLQELLQDSNMVDGFQAVSIASGSDIYAFLDTLNQTNGIVAAEPYYFINDSLPAPVGDQIVVGFDSTLSKASIDSLAAAHGADTVRELEYMHNVFVLHNTNPQTKRLVALANDIYGASGVQFSHPNFGMRPVLLTYRLYDHYNGSQAHLKKIIGTFNSASVWDFNGTRDTIVVAVIDDGVTTHEDLPQTRVFGGRDFSNIPYDSNASPGQLQGHGMGCSGIIAASHTTDSVAGQNSSTGVISMSPGVKILPVKIFTDAGGGIGAPQIADAISYAYQSGADVLSNSWGYGDGTDRIR
jgi:hypothetical protein